MDYMKIMKVPWESTPISEIPVNNKNLIFLESIYQSEAPQLSASSDCISFCSSVGKGPCPTRVVYAFTTPITVSTHFGGTPSPVHTLPTVVLELVTKG
jgi:hypothetical protein